jgi:FtsH-binding integral membrane protein
MTQDVIVNSVAAALTLMVLSRIAGDNPLFRIAQYLFVGVSLGLAFVVAYHQALRPAVVALLSAEPPALWLYGVPLALGLLLLPRITGDQRLSWLANIPLALVFGVGGALAIGGAIIGTLLPQIRDTARAPSGEIGAIIGVAVLVIGTVLTLASFYYTTPPESRSGRMIRGIAMIGHWLIMVAFGFFFAGALQSYLSALVERLNFVLAVVRSFFGA